MCSVIGLWRRGAALMGASYDFYYGHGLLVANRRGLRKMALGEQAPQLEWEARYGSLTLNQFGRELPTCGMNEAGLAIHLLEQDRGEYPPPRAEQAINELQWIQYQLDRHANIAQVLAQLGNVTIEKAFFNLHYALCDRHGEIAFVDFVDGRPEATVSTADQAGVALANHAYAEACRHADEVPAQRLRRAASGNSSHARFLRLRQWAAAYDAQQEPVAYAMRALDSVFRRPGFGDLFRWILLRRAPVTSFWHTVFDPTALKLHYRTAATRQVRSVTLSELDFSPAAPTLVADLANDYAGDMTMRLRPYARADNARIVRESYAPLRGRVPQDQQEQLIDYPDSFSVLQS